MLVWVVSTTKSARSFTGWQAGFVTDSTHSMARIRRIDSVRLENDTELQKSNQFVFTDRMDPGELTIYKLYILWPEDKISPVYSDLVDYIQVTVDATQID